MLGLADKCRATSKRAVSALQELGLECIMLTGDNEGAAEAIKYQVGLTHCCFSMKPKGKSDWITNAQVNIFVFSLYNMQK